MNHADEYVAGIDIGAATAKAVVLKNGVLLGYQVLPTGYDVLLAGKKAIDLVLQNAGVERKAEELDFVATTGYGRDAIPYSKKSITEILCHAKGAQFMIPECRFIIDIGGQDSKAIEVLPNGMVADFAMNDKCAAGSGRFLEVMAQILEVGGVQNMGPISLESAAPCPISNICTVFAETEVVVHRAEGAKREDLIAGVHESLAYRVHVMAQGLTVQNVAVFTGGVAKNIGVKRCLEKEFGVEFQIPPEPQIVGALGAALYAREALAEASD